MGKEQKLKEERRQIRERQNDISERKNKFSPFLVWGAVILIVVVAVLGFKFLGGEESAVKIKNDNVALEGEGSAPLIEQMPIATIKTGRGNIGIELFPEAAPKTVANFASLAKQGFYDGVKFHRVIPGFVVQGGDPLSRDDDPLNDGTGGPGYVFEDEINPRALGLPDVLIKQLESLGYEFNYNLPVSYPVDVGYVAMANSGPGTNGSQFFIVTEENQPHLYGKHTVFGRVMEGMEAVRQIRQGDAIEKILVTGI